MLFRCGYHLGISSMPIVMSVLCPFALDAKVRPIHHRWTSQFKPARLLVEVRKLWKNYMSNERANGGLQFEADLFKAADKLRGNLEPSEYKHVTLGLIFLKYISEAFEAQRAASRVSVLIKRFLAPRRGLL